MNGYDSWLTNAPEPEEHNSKHCPCDNCEYERATERATKCGYNTKEENACSGNGYINLDDEDEKGIPSFEVNQDVYPPLYDNTKLYTICKQCHEGDIKSYGIFNPYLYIDWDKE